MQIRLLLALLVTLVWILPDLKGQSPIPGACSSTHEDSSCGLYALSEDQFSFIAPPEGFVFGAARTVNITVNYTGFTPQAQTAFQYAVDIWASSLSSNVTIVIDANFTALSGGVLGFASASDYRRNFAGAPVGDTWYPIALANKLAGSDLDPGDGDIECTFNSNFTWYYGTDGNCPGGQYDFVTVVLHELCHGLGFTGFGDVNGTLGTVRQLGSPSIYDRKTEDLAGTDLVTMPDNSVTLGNALTSNNVYWFGTIAMGANGGIKPRLYAPGSWDSGSSYSHTNENTYPSGNINSLMTPFLGSAEANHNPGPIVYGMFEDMGWDFSLCDITNVTIGTTSACNPVNNQYTQQVIVTYSNPPSSGQININGVNFNITTSPQTCTLTLASNGVIVDCDVYFTEEVFCEYHIDNAWQAPSQCCDDLRIMSVNSSNDQIAIKNFGTCTTNLSNFQLCSDGSCTNISGMTIISGGMFVGNGQTTVVQWNSFSATSQLGNISLHDPGAAVSDANGIIDFMQWGASGQGAETIANSEGLWVAGTYITEYPPFSFTGTNTQYGVQYWDGTTPPCTVLGLSAGSQTTCSPDDNSYTQQITVTYISPPGTGYLVVNSQNFVITSSPQTVTLSNLNSDSSPVNVTASFSSNGSCTLSSNNLFIAPAFCECPADFNNDNQTDVQDFLFFLADFGCTSDCAADLTGDDITGTADLLQLTALFASPCP